MYFIGIDFSITSPAVCLTKDFKNFTFISAINLKTTKKYRKFLLEDIAILPNINIIEVDYTKRVKSEDYHITERNKLSNYTELVNSLVLQIKKIVKSEACIVSIEGISFESKGNSLVDISQATGMLRKTILEVLLDNDKSKLFVFSPATLKIAIGAKGNASKFDILKIFLTDPKIDTIKKSVLFKVLTEYKDTIMTSNTIKSPFNDLVDAYLAVLQLYNELHKK